MNLSRSDTVVIFIALVALVLALIGPPWSHVPTVPSCQEDEVVVGVGDFDNGYWSGYECRNFEEVR